LGPWSDAPLEPIPVYIPPGGPVADPTLAIDSKGTLYAAWWGRGFGEIFLSKSGNRGRTWSEPLNVSNTPLGSDFPVLAVGPRDRLYLVWEDFSIIPVIGEIVVSISDDGGATWTPYQNLSQTKPSSSRPSVVVNGQGVVSIVWIEERGQLMFTRSTDEGATWSAPKEIAPGSTANRTRAPALVETPDGTLWVAGDVDGRASPPRATAAPRGEPAVERRRTGGLSDARGGARRRVVRRVVGFDGVVLRYSIIPPFGDGWHCDGDDRAGQYLALARCPVGRSRHGRYGDR
jgi:hypothetical protein